MGIMNYRFSVTTLMRSIICTLIVTIIALHSVDEAACKTRITSSEMRDYVLLQQAYDFRNWEQALKLTDYFLIDYPASIKRSSAIFIAAQASLNLRQINRAQMESKRLLLSYPESIYSDQAHWIVAQGWLMSEQYDSAEVELNWILNNASDTLIQELATKQLDELTSYLYFEAKTEELANNLTSDSLSVALILPLTGGKQKGAAEDFLLGFRITWENFGYEAPLIYDNKSDPINSVLIFKNVVQKHGVWAVIGGINQLDAAAIAATADKEKIPFLSTSCGVTGLGAIGDYAFQGRIDYNRIGESLAEYIVNTDSTGQRFGILAPMSQEGQQIAAGFKKVLTDDSSEVLVEDYYYPGTDDFASYLKHFRKVGIWQMFADSLKSQLEISGGLEFDGNLFLSRTEEIAIDSVLTDSLIDSLWIAEHKRLQQEIEDSEIEIDSLEIPVSIYDGFLLIIEEGKGKIEALASQFARFNIQAQILGNESWMDSEALYRVRNYVEGIVFAQPFLESEGTESSSFRGAILGNGSDRLNKYHLAGDRAARIIAQAAKNSRDPQDLARGISQIRDLETLSGRVSFVQTEGTANSVNLIRFTGGMFENVATIPDTVQTGTKH